MICSLHRSEARTVAAASKKPLELCTVRRIEALAPSDDVRAQSLTQSRDALRARVTTNPHPLGDDAAGDTLRDPRQKLAILGGECRADIVHDAGDDSRRQRRPSVRAGAHASRILGAARRDNVFTKAVDACGDVVPQTARRRALGAQVSVADRAREVGHYVTWRSRARRYEA